MSTEPRDPSGPRPARLIHNEVTTEIPVHLLFRDEPAPGPVTVPLTPAVVGRRRGTGEQPRIRPAPVPPAPHPAIEADPGLVEHPGRPLPGFLGVLAGCAGTVGCAIGTWWAGLLPAFAERTLALPDAGPGDPGPWPLLAGAASLTLFGFGGLTRGRTGRAVVLTLFGRYRGTVRRTGLLWLNPLLPRRRMDVRLRHWRSEPMPATDPNGVALRAVVLVVWRVRDTARAAFAVDDHETYLRECVEAALARVRLETPAPYPVEAAGEALTGLVAADVAPVGLDVFAVRPVRVEYAPEVAELVRDLTVAFCTSPGGGTRPGRNP